MRQDTIFVLADDTTRAERATVADGTSSLRGAAFSYEQGPPAHLMDFHSRSNAAAAPVSGTGGAVSTDLLRK
jgi:hypothetical protein